MFRDYVSISGHTTYKDIIHMCKMCMQCIIIIIIIILYVEFVLANNQTNNRRPLRAQNLVC